MAAKAKKRLGSYPFVNVVFSITSALFMVGLFGLMVLYGNSLTSKLRQLEIQIFLQRNIDSTQVAELKNLLETQEFVKKKDGGESVVFVPKEDAAQKMIEETGKDFMAFLGENPLRNAFQLQIDEGFRSSEELAQVKERLEDMPYVFEVSFAIGQVEEIYQNLQKVGGIILFFIIILQITVVILINNAIKLALFSQRFLIRSMQLVGATSWFIKKPFLKTAIFQGLISGMMASALLLVILFLGNSLIDGLDQIHNLWGILIILSLLIVLGGVISFFSCLNALGRYLNMKLDELY
ncbi:permease-like cell division protein FtsX [Flammeovirgaceae bacterium SG7u.111]|nr:permease-like cell division protein FtsX [Flammeovirgaceae bacterium SG7u.132]WPO34147.1 permease-like cell division protein FtsX [Flammeovirgaceae bacterium SG7u.111]